MGVNLVVPGAPDWAQSSGFDDYLAACTWFWTQMRQGGFGDQVELWARASTKPIMRTTSASRRLRGTRPTCGSLLQLLAAARDTLGMDGVPVTTRA